MKVQLTAVDMDGTVLNPFGHISEENALAIRQFQAQGGEFVICTGRNYPDARCFVDEVGIQCNFICISGAAIMDYEGNYLLKIVMTGDEIAEIMEVLEQYGLSMDLITNDGYYTTSTPEQKFLDYYHAMAGQFSDPSLVPRELEQQARERMDKILFVGSPQDVLKQHVDIYKICVNHLEPDFAAALKKEFRLHPRFAAASSFTTNIEITPVRAQKGLALRQYAAMKHIPLEAVMTIGDADNDLSMMTPDFGYSVAMENAMDCVKAAAKYKTRSNSEDGVAWAIRNIALGMEAGLLGL